MDDTLYRKLIDGICEHAKAAPSPERYDRCDLLVDGTLFTLMPSRDAKDRISAVAYFADVGPLPEQNSEAAAIELLQSNLFMFGQSSPCFCCNPETGHVLLTGHVPLEPLTAESALQSLSMVADFALHWYASHQHSEQRSQPANRPVSRTTTSLLGV